MDEYDFDIDGLDAQSAAGLVAERHDIARAANTPVGIREAMEEVEAAADERYLGRSQADAISRTPTQSLGDFIRHPEHNEFSGMTSAEIKAALGVMEDPFADLGRGR